MRLLHGPLSDSRQWGRIAQEKMELGKIPSCGLAFDAAAHSCSSLVIPRFVRQNSTKITCRAGKDVIKCVHAVKLNLALPGREDL